MVDSEIMEGYDKNYPENDNWDETTDWEARHNTQDPKIEFRFGKYMPRKNGEILLQSEMREYLNQIFLYYNDRCARLKGKQEADRTVFQLDVFSGEKVVVYMVLHHKGYITLRFKLNRNPEILEFEQNISGDGEGKTYPYRILNKD